MQIKQTAIEETNVFLNLVSISLAIIIESPPKLFISVTIKINKQMLRTMQSISMTREVARTKGFFIFYLD